MRGGWWKRPAAAVLLAAGASLTAAEEEGAPVDFSPAAAPAVFARTLQSTLDFWTSPEVIDPAGGYHTWFDADGRKCAPAPESPTASEAGKPFLVQLRVLYAHAVAIPRTADPAERRRLRAQYEHGFRFLERYRDAASGLFITSVGFDGKPYDAEVRAVTQIYGIYIFSEIAAQISDHRALELARQIFARFDRQAHDARAGGYFEYFRAAAPAKQGIKQVGSNMHAALALARLMRVDPSPEVRDRLAELFGILTSDRLLHPSGNGYMTVDRDWRPVLSGPPDGMVLYGHNAELAWYLLEAAEMLRISPETMKPWLERVAAPIMKFGIFPDGKAAIFGPQDGPAQPVTMPRWWTQLEAMNMLARLYEVTGDRRYLDRFEQVARYSYAHLVNPANGVWYGGVELTTGERRFQGGWAWKSGLHVIRSMRLLLGVCDRMRDGWKPPRRFKSASELPKKSIQVSLGFPYNHRRSAASLVSELRANGYDTVFLIVKDGKLAPDRIVETARAAGMQVWGSFFGPGTFMSDRLFGERSKEWRMEFTVKRPNRYFSYVHPEYRQWWKTFLNDLYDRHPFSGFVFYESHYGTAKGLLAFGRPPWFGDISPGFVRRFQQETGHDRFPNFTDPASPEYYETDRGLYADYVDYRVKSIIDFHREIWDGDGGLRRRHPELAFATWTIALAADGALPLMREAEAQDGARMAAELGGDLHFFQSHWPDWLPEKQRPSYLDGYRPYVESIRRLWPEMPLAVQGDVASTCAYRRSPEWMAEFDRTAAKNGFNFTTWYEFAVRYAVYFEPPRAVSGTLTAAGTGQVVFDQVIAPESAAALTGRRLAGGRRIESAAADGNLLNFRVAGALRPGETVSLPLDGITDDPSVRVKMPKLGFGRVNPVPAGSSIGLSVR